MKRCDEVVSLLGAHADTALDAEAGESVTEHLRGCASCRDRQALIAAQGRALREVMIARGAAADFSGFADRVMARVGQEKGRAPLGAWGSELWGAHRGAFAAVGGLALAACAALAVLFTPAQATDDAALLADASGPEVQQVDFGTHDGAVLQLPNQTTVIWMSDDRAAVPQ